MYSKRSNLELQAYELHLKITQNLNYFQYLLFEERLVYILDKVEYKYEHKLNRLEKKFYKLNTPSKVNTINHSHIEESTNLVQNLSTYTFTTSEITILQKGLNFSFKPTNEKQNIFVDVETNLKFLPNNEKLAIKSDIIASLDKENEIKSANNYLYRTIIKGLKKKDVFYLKADKSNTIVILDKPE